jgi:adenylate kinase
MKIVLLGAPGAGKGTQAVRLAERYKVPHISTGDIFRKNIKERTPIGVEAKSYIDKGQLVPDEVTIRIVKDRLQEKDCENGYLLDGFPRNVFQAKALDDFSEVDKVVNIDVPLHKLMRRITGRRVCGKCGESYHIDYLDGKTECGKCGGNLTQRADDNEETVKSRLDVYVGQTAPLTEYYKERGVLVDVDGDGTMDEVFETIVRKLG